MKKLSVLLFATMMAFAFVSCDKDKDDERNTDKALEPSEQGSFLLQTLSSLVDQVNASDFEPVAALIERYQDFNLNSIIAQSPELANKMELAQQQMMQEDGSILYSLAPYNGKYTIGEDNIVKVEAADNIQIIDNTVTPAYTLTLNHKDGNIFPFKTISYEDYESGEEIEITQYIKIPESASLELACGGQSVASLDLDFKATFHNTFAEFDSSKDALVASASLSLCGYKLAITNASIKDNKMDFAANLTKGETQLLDATFNINDFTITNAVVTSMTDAAATLSIMNAIKVKASAPSFSDIVELSDQYSEEESLTQSVAQKYADQFNNLFTASVYYNNSDIEQSKLILVPSYGVTSGEYIFMPGIKIGDDIFTLSNYEGFFTQEALTAFTAKLMAKAVEFSMFFGNQITIDPTTIL